MDKLRSVTAIEILSVSNSMEGLCEKLDNRLTGHFEETDKRMNKITEEIKTKKNILETDLCRHVQVTDGDVQSLRQELIEVKQQITMDVSVKIFACNCQIVTEKQEYRRKSLKVRQEINKLKESISVNLKVDKTINISNNSNGYALFTLANGCNQEETVSVVSSSNQASYQKSVSGGRACENISVAREYRMK
jgi:hypothetical protein